jgi:ABC-type taurine transport system ATPase subunit
VIDRVITSWVTDAIATRRNILVSGGSGTGKTTLLNAIAARIPDHDRIVVVEEFRVDGRFHPGQCTARALPAAAYAPCASP